MNKDDLMWVEKYRPKKLNEIVGLRHIVESVQAFLKNPKTMPHLLLAGIPGTGKTTMALCIARELFGDNWKTFTLELNASDERGINTVRDRIKGFSRYSRASFGNVPFALIILDESDQMTRPAQTALRRIMETSSRTSRFILICNYSNKIIEPIQSRCAIFRFSKLDKTAMVEHIKNIAEKEKLQVSSEVAKKIIDYSDGDLRYAINALQTAAAYGEGEITEKTVLQVVGEASPKQVQLMLTRALSGDFSEARKMMYDLIGQYGFSGSEIVRQV
ncbi:replication factor C small subunit, partial [Candidatus Bathyarchaeota archaeon]|nr:replication factor C small subunit [Candidatus Bathyarchaeota archaeon]